MLLHNVCRKRNIPLVEDEIADNDESSDEEDAPDEQDGNQREDANRGTGAEVRTRLIQERFP